MMLLRMQKLQHTYSLLLLKRQGWTCRNGCSASRNLSVSQIFPTKFPKTAIQRVFFTAKFWFSQVPFKYHDGWLLTWLQRSGARLMTELIGRLQFLS